MESLKLIRVVVYWAVYDSGSVFSPAVLDITEEDLLKKFVAVSTCRRETGSLPY